MKKPRIGCYERFAAAFAQASAAAGKQQYLVPYFITGHPDNIAHLTGESRFEFVRHNISTYTYIAGPLDGVRGAAVNVASAYEVEDAVVMAFRTAAGLTVRP